MLVIKILFTANRYHATQWGRHVNEGVLEWPPSPWRVLRGIVATWRRTLPDIPPDRVVAALKRLASEHPVYKLPIATRGHTRHYMPYNDSMKKRTTLIIDSFIAVKPGDPMYIVWQGVDLDVGRRRDLDRILRNMPYLGRAESWVAAELTPHYLGQLNSLPVETGALPEGDWEIVRTLVPRTPIELQDLLVETGDLRKDGHIDPKRAQWWTYVRKPDCFTEFRRHNRRQRKQGEEVQVVRFALSGKVLPMSLDTLRLGDLARKSVMSQYGRQNNGNRSQFLSGKNSNGTPLMGHKHPFYLPTDEDGDGRLDHLTIWAPGGLNDKEFRAVIAINTLNPGRQRDPIRLVYQAHGTTDDFNGVSPLFGKHTHWRSLTPYVLTRHIKFRGPKDEFGRRRIVDSPEDQIMREVSLRYPGTSNLISVGVNDKRTPIMPIQGGKSSGFRPFNYYRYRQGGPKGGTYNFDLKFSEPIDGPVALGYACHYGLGIFVPAQ